MQTVSLRLPVVLPGGPECERCVVRLQEELTRIKGVSGAAVNNARTDLSVEFDPDVVTLSRIELEAHRIGAEIDARIEHHTAELRDLDCPDCAVSIERTVAALPGVLWASANFAAMQIHVEYERGKVTLKQIHQAITSHGVRACALNISAEEARELGLPKTIQPHWIRDNRKMIFAVACVADLLLGMLLERQGFGLVAIYVYIAAMIIGGHSILRACIAALSRRSYDMNVLMSIAVIGAAAMGDWQEAAMVVALFGVGAALQTRALERTRQGIRDLLNLRPANALVIRGTGEFSVPLDQVRLWETVVVRPGEVIPMDGEILSGESAINEAPITGESVPVDKVPGDEVFAGTLNGQSLLHVKVTRVSRDTTLARIIHRVEEAHAQRAPTQLLVDRFARRYTPIVILLALAVGVLPPLTQYIVHSLKGASTVNWYWMEWAHRALSLLIIACPCALAISTPVAIVTAIGRAARMGALIKGGAYLEEIERVKAILYDKTGTLTKGRFELEDVLPLGDVSCNDILAITSAIEARSEHPLASAFVGRSRETDAGALVKVDEYRALSGLGAMARIGQKTYFVGNAGLMEKQGIPLAAARETVDRIEAMGRTAVILSTRDEPVGVAILSDQPREGTRATVQELKRMGIQYQAMLTGDNAHVAASVAKEAGLDEFKSRLLPEEKLGLVKEFQWRYGTVAMVGDGVNDAPALAASNVGIVMGAASSDVAMETADIALLGEDLSKLPSLIRLSRATRKVISQNIAVSVASKVALVGAAMFVGIPLWLAVLGDVGVSLLVTVNSLRLRWA